MGRIANNTQSCVAIFIGSQLFNNLPKFKHEQVLQKKKDSQIKTVVKIQMGYIAAVIDIRPN